MAERLEAAGKGASILPETGTKELLGQTVPQNGKLAPLERWPEPWVAQCEEFLKALDLHCFRQEESPALTKPGPWDDAKAFLASFERVAEACHWPREEWAARLLPALSGKAERAFSRLDARDREDYGKVKAAIFQEEANGMEALRQHFRQFRYQGLEDPRRIYGQLRERCLLWLKPERHSKEQILELLILEQFRAILPQEIKSWEADAGSPQILVEECRHHPQEAKTWEWQVPLDEVSRSSPGMAETAESQAYEEAEEKVNKELGLLADRIMTPHHPNPVLPPKVQDMAEVGLMEGNVPLNGSLGSAEWSTSNATQGTMHWEVMQGNLEDVSRLGGFVIPKPEAVPQMEQGEIILHRDSENREAFPGSISDDGKPLKIKEEDYQSTQSEPKEPFLVPLEISQGEASLVAEIHKHSDHGVMAPKKASEGGKRKKAKILLEVKKEIIRKHEEGMRLIDLAREYGRNISTIGTILKMKEKITRRDAAKGVSRVSKQRPPVLEEVEKLLLLWIEEKQRVGDTVTEAAICAKAKALHADLLAQQPGTSADAEGFKASRGWFERFKARSGFHGVARHGEATSSNVAAAEDFAAVFLEAVVSEGYLPQQVFNCDETGLFWKKMPKRTFLAQEVTSLPGHEPMKDRLTLLLCANASGDLKIKPLLVYHLENPQAFKKHQVKKEQLSVLWRSSPKAWVTRLLFAEWVNLVFGPAVKQYLVDNRLPLKAVLLMDNAPAHPPGLEEELREDFNFIKVMFLPPNTTPLLQPMNQQVISSFKQLYTRELFRRCFEVTDGSSLALREFWRDHFDLVSCLQVITLAWAGVSQRNLNTAWRNLWPDCVVTIDSDASAPAPESTVLDEIVSLGRTMGLEVTEGDVCELVEEHDRELTTEDLMELQKEAMEERISFEEEETTEGQLSSRELKEACQMWEDLQTFVQQHHPDKALAQRLVNSFDTDIMSPFRGMLKRRQRLQTTEGFLIKRPRHEEEPACVTATLNF